MFAITVVAASMMVPVARPSFGTQYVDPSSPAPYRDGENWYRAHHRIGPAIRQAAPGEEIRVAGYFGKRVYKENLALLLKPVKLMGGYAGYEYFDDPDWRDPQVHKTWIHGLLPGAAAVAVYADGSVVDGFWITDGGCGILCNGVTTRTTIIGNWIRASEESGVFCQENASPTITNNVIWYNGGNGILCQLTSSPTVTNNTIIWNSGSGVKLSNSAAKIYNNIICYNGEVGIYQGPDCRLKISHNDVAGNGEGDYRGCRPGKGDISAEPQLRRDGYHLEARSPCVDMGENSAPGLPANDVDGQPRIGDGDKDGASVVDMGADEMVPIVYVDCDAPGPTHDGRSWDTAFLTMQEGIDAATPGDDVWVAEGTYAENIRMAEGVGIYGGFLGAKGGYETALNQRDFVNRKPTIDGHGAGVCVVAADDARLDGFIITNGVGMLGGGILCRFCSPVIANNTVTGNSARDGGGIFSGSASPVVTNNTITANRSIRGGGICCHDSSPAVAGNAISDNSADWEGGGIFCDGGSPTVSRNTITHNSADCGAGMHCAGSSLVVVTGNAIANNWAGCMGGGIYCYAESSPTLTNNTIYRNRALWGGGICCDEESYPTLTNNTIHNNSAQCGGGVECEIGSSPTLTNNAVTENSAERGGGIYGWESSPGLGYNDFWRNSPDDYWGCPPGSGDISADPMYAAAEKGDFHLSCWQSPCVDAGDNRAPALPAFDFEGDPRIQDGNHDGRAVVDIGADEFPLPPEWVPERDVDPGTPMQA